MYCVKIKIILIIIIINNINVAFYLLLSQKHNIFTHTNIFIIILINSETIKKLSNDIDINILLCEILLCLCAYFCDIYMNILMNSKINHF